MADGTSKTKEAMISKPIPTISRKHEEGDLLMGGILDGDDDLATLRSTAKSAPPDLYLQNKSSLQQVSQLSWKAGISPSTKQEEIQNAAAEKRMQFFEERQYFYSKEYHDFYKQQNNPRMQKPLTNSDIYDHPDLKALQNQLKGLTLGSNSLKDDGNNMGTPQQLLQHQQQPQPQPNIHHFQQLRSPVLQATPNSFQPQSQQPLNLDDLTTLQQLSYGNTGDSNPVNQFPPGIIRKVSVTVSGQQVSQNEDNNNVALNSSNMMMGLPSDIDSQMALASQHQQQQQQQQMQLISSQQQSQQQQQQQQQQQLQQMPMQQQQQQGPIYFAPQPGMMPAGMFGQIPIMYGAPQIQNPYIMNQQPFLYNGNMMYSPEGMPVGTFFPPPPPPQMVFQQDESGELIPAQGPVFNSPQFYNPQIQQQQFPQQLNSMQSQQQQQQQAQGQQYPQGGYSNVNLSHSNNGSNQMKQQQNQQSNQQSRYQNGYQLNNNQFAIKKSNSNGNNYNNNNNHYHNNGLQQNYQNQQYQQNGGNMNRGNKTRANPQMYVPVVRNGQQSQQSPQQQQSGNSVGRNVVQHSNGGGNASMQYNNGMKKRGNGNQSGTNSQQSMYVPVSSLQNVNPNIGGGEIDSTEFGLQFASSSISQQLQTQNLIELCKDQNSSRTIQKIFEGSRIEERAIIFDQIYPEALNLMKDQFGNYVIQKLLENGTLEQKEKLVSQIKGNVEDLSLHTYGCRVIQKALEELKELPAVQQEMIAELDKKIMECIQDQNGNHVIQKCFETLPTSKLTSIIKEVIRNIDELAFHPYGCRVIQRILQHCSSNETKDIYVRLMANLLKLCECQFGNYIIQHIIECDNSAEKAKILDVIRLNFVSLSLNKFASNVTEKSVVHSDQAFKAGVLDVLLQQLNPSGNLQIQGLDTGMIRLTKNAFGNYVVQRLYQNSSQEIKLRICQYLLHNNEIFNEVSSNSYGKRVLSYIEKNRMDGINGQPIFTPIIQNPGYNNAAGNQRQRN